MVDPVRLANYDRMDRVDFDSALEDLERMIKKAQMSLSKTRKDLLTGGYATFATEVFCNDLLKAVDKARAIRPESFQETFPIVPDDVNVDTTETTH